MTLLPNPAGWAGGTAFTMCAYVQKPIIKGPDAFALFIALVAQVRGEEWSSS